jgi:hypothetical protein
MVWTAAEFKTQTDLGTLYSRSENALKAIDNALAAYDLVRRAVLRATQRAALVDVETAIDGWLYAKRNKIASSRRAAINTLRTQVQDEIQRLDDLTRQAQEAEDALRLPIAPPRIEPPTIRFDGGRGSYVYDDPNTNLTTPVPAEDWEIRRAVDGNGRCYSNRRVAFTRRIVPEDWEELFDDQNNNRRYYRSRITGMTTLDVPAELTPEMVRAREIVLFVNARGWVPANYYTVTNDTERGLGAATMTAYRKSLAELNADKEAITPKVRIISRGDTVHLRIREDIQTAKLTTGPYSQRSKAPIDMAQINTWEGARVLNGANFIEAKKIARRAVRFVRHHLPLGAFNNRAGVDPRPATWSRNPGSDMHRLEELAAALLGVSTDFFHAMAANAAGVRAMGGGVCSMIGAFTAGVLTVISPPDTEIIYCYHSADHAYCVVSYKKSQWVCSDPWPLVPYPAIWETSYFAPRTLGPLKYYTKIDVLQPTRIPFGLVAIGAQSLEYAAVLVKKEECRGGPGAIGHAYGHASNTSDNSTPALYEEEKAIVKNTDWGPVVNYAEVFPELV